MDTMERVKGPVEILCKEIGYPFDMQLETPEIFLSFVSVLVETVAEIRDWKIILADKVASGELPSNDSDVVLERVRALVASNDYDGLTEKCSELHTFIDSVAPDDAYPCDHLIDMLNGCVSAVRFGLETPCHSRHAADAAGHIWGKRYGVTVFDQHTNKWSKEWARAQMQKAVLARLSSAPPKAGEP